MSYDIVIRSPNWIGDCIMALPAIRALKDNFPEGNIYLAAKQYLYDIYQNIEEIKEIIPIPDRIDVRTIFKASGRLKKYHFEWGLLFTNSFSSALLFKLAGVKKSIGYANEWRGFLLHKKIEFPQNNRHHIYFYLDLAEAFLEEKTGKKITERYANGLVITAEEREKASALLSAAGVDLSQPMVGMSPSAAYGSAKEWLPERFRALIERIHREKPDVEILLLGSAKEKEKIARISGPGRSSGKIHNLAGQLGLRQAIAAISLCNLFISNDSGPMHIASSLGLPMIALFGPTRSHKTGPLNKNAKIIHYPVECAPCNHRECPLDHRCMKAISVDEVYETLVSLMPSPGLPPLKNE